MRRYMHCTGTSTSQAFSSGQPWRKFAEQFRVKSCNGVGGAAGRQRGSSSSGSWAQRGGREQLAHQRRPRWLDIDVDVDAVVQL